MPKEINCANTIMCIRYLEKYYPDIPIDDILSEIFSTGKFQTIDKQSGKLVPIDKEFILNPDNWVSAEFFATLYGKGREITGDPLFAYKVGREAFNLSGNLIRKTLLHFLPVTEIIRGIPEENNKTNNTKRVEVIKNEKGHAIVRLHFKKGLYNANAEAGKDACSQNRGVYEALGRLTGNLAVIKETCCTFEGAEYCEFDIRWKNKPFFSRLKSALKRWVAGDVIRELEEKERKNVDLIHEQEQIIEARTRQLHEAQARLVEAEKRALEHRITGGFAHEMRNALTGAQLEFKTLLDYEGSGKSSCEILQQATTALMQRIAEIHEKYGVPREEIAREIVPELKKIAELSEHMSEVHSGVARDIERGLLITGQIREYAKLAELRRGEEEVGILKILRSYGDRYRLDFDRVGVSYEVICEVGECDKGRRDAVGFYIQQPCSKCYGRAGGGRGEGG